MAHFVRKSPTLRTTLPRWLSVLTLTYLSAVGIHVLLPWAIAVWRRSIHLDSANRTLLFAALWSAVAIGGYLLASLVRIKARHLQSALRYPPLWLAGPLAVAGDMAGHRVFPVLRFSADVVAALWPGRAAMAIGALTVGVISRRLVELLRAPAELPPPEPLAKPQEELSWRIISDWARAEEEGGIDLLNHARIAGRLAKVIADDSVENRRATALVGPIGSGKSTILKRVEWQLQQGVGASPAIEEKQAVPTAVWTCWVSCWGIDDSKLLAGHVLRTLVEVIGRHVDATELRGIPDSYLKMLGATKLGPLEGLLHRDQQDAVNDGLSRIPPILEVLGARIVVFIEDGDRGRGKDFDPTHLEGLIAKLRTVDRITCVIALDRDRIEFDISKLCEHIELMPVLDVEAVRRVILATREGCLRSTKFVDPRPEGMERDLLDLRPADEYGVLTFVRRTHTRSVCDAMAEVISTPRRLKHVVRRVERSWRRLCGEVDLDHLILVSVIKECCPNLFRFLLRHVDPIRQKSDDYNKDPELTRSAWDALLAQDEQSAIAARLVKALGLLQVLGGSATAGRSIQGAEISEPSDYFRRLLAEDIDDEVKDQDVLRDIDAWIGGAGDGMVKKLSGEVPIGHRYPVLWSYFAYRIPSERLVSLVDELFEPLLASVRQEGKWALSAGTQAVWTHVNRFGGIRLVGADRVSGMTMSLIPDSLEGAVATWKHWRHGAADEATERRTVREAMLVKAEATYSDPQGLIHALRGDSGTGGLLGLVELGKHESFGWLVPSVLQAMRRSPDLLAGQVAELVGTFMQVARTDPTQASERYELNRKLIEEVFAENVDELLTQLGSADPSGRWFVREARDQALLWLEERAAKPVNDAGTDGSR